jgi:hypothetical protein
MQDKTTIEIKEEKTIQEIIDPSNKYFDNKTYLQLKDMLNNLNSSNLRLFEKILNEFKDKSEEEKKANYYIHYYFFQIYNFLKREDNINNIDYYSIYYTFQCLLNVILENKLSKFFDFDETNLKKEINQFSNIIELLDQKTKLEKKKKQNKRDRIKRKLRVNAFRKICGLPTGEEINEYNNKQKEFKKNTGLSLLDKEKNKIFMKYNFIDRKKNNITKTNNYYDSDEEVRYIDPDDYGGMINPYGLPTQDELNIFLGKKNKLLFSNTFI